MNRKKLQANGKHHHPYIDNNPEISGGKPIISGTRMKVLQIVIEYERLGWTPDQIIDAHPHLTLAQVHDALSYYYDHQAELDAEIIVEAALVVQLRQEYPVLLPGQNSC